MNYLMLFIFMLFIYLFIIWEGGIHVEVGVWLEVQM